MMEATEVVLTLNDLIQLAVVIAGLWGFYKIVKEIVKTITDRHDREQKWDEMSSNITKNIQGERDKIYMKYDSQLEDLKKEIEENHSETEAKMQELSAGMLILTKSVRAILEGQMKQGLNGPVAKAKEELDEFIDNRAFD